MNRKEIGEAIRARRIAAGLAQRHVAEIAECTRESIGNIESGRHNPSLDVLVRILAAVGAEIELATVPGPDGAWVCRGIVGDAHPGRGWYWIAQWKGERASGEAATGPDARQAAEVWMAARGAPADSVRS